jgi:ribosome-binding factor A
MPLPYLRADRVGDLIRRELSRLLLREVKDPRLRAVTITAVRVSADLRHARVLFTAQSDSPGALEGLRSATGFLRGQLGRHLRLRYAPELAFEVDGTVEESLHLAALFKRLAQEGDRGE